MGIFGRKKAEEAPPTPSKKNTTNNRTVTGATSKSRPKRSKSSDAIDLTGFNRNVNKKTLRHSGSFERKPLRPTRSGLTRGDAKSLASTKSSKSTKSATFSKNKSSLEKLMSLQNETNKVAADSKWGTNVLADSNNNNNNSSSSTHNTASNSSTNGRSAGKKKPLKSSDRGRSKSPTRNNNNNNGGGRHDKSPKRSRTPSRARSRSLGRGLKSSKSDNLSGMISGGSGKATTSTTTTTTMSKLAQMKQDEVATLKKENHDLYTKKKSIQRQLEEERDKNETLEKKLKDLQRQLERGNKINNSKNSKKNPTQQLEERIESLQQELTEVQTKLKKERREHEQILFEKEKELKELDESLEQFMVADRSKGGNNNSNAIGGGVTDRKLRNELAQSKAALKVAEGQLSKLQTEIGHKDLELKTLKGKRSSLETITKADTDSIHIMKENEELHEKLKFKDETIDHLMDQLKTLKLSGSSDVKRRMSGRLNPESNAEDSGLTGLWNKLSPGTLRNKKTLNREQRKDMATLDVS